MDKKSTRSSVNFCPNFSSEFLPNRAGSYRMKLCLRFQGHHLGIFRFFILFQDILSVVVAGGFVGPPKKNGLANRWKGTPDVFFL